MKRIAAIRQDSWARCRAAMVWLVSPQYRATRRIRIHAQRELARLRSMPPYQVGMTDVLGMPFELVDAPSFRWTYRELFEQEIYAFNAKTEQPYILDGGANIGLSVVYFKRRYPSSQIVAFEPDPQIFAVLQRNIARSGYDQIELVDRALWCADTTLSFFHEGADGGRIAEGSAGQYAPVRTIRLRDYLDRPVDFLKLDIEGAETVVLQDCADRLMNVDHLFVEYHSFADQPQTLHVVCDILSRAGFRLQIHARSPLARPFADRAPGVPIDLQLDIFASRP